MKRIEITTRGLSPLEMQIAELALALKETGETLPSNLAKKFVGEVESAASKSSRYYIDISGRKSYLLNDVTSFVNDFPLNTLFTCSDVLKRFRHPSPSVNAALRKLHTTDLDLDLCSLGGYYIKPSKGHVKLNTGYRPDVGTEWYVDFRWGKHVEKCQNIEEVIKLSKESKKKAIKFLRLESQRYKRQDFGHKSSKEIMLGKSIAKEVVSFVVQNTFQRINESLLKKGYVYRPDIPILPFYSGPPVLLTRGNLRASYELDIRDSKVSSGSHGDDNKIYFRNLEEQCFDNSGLITPIYNGKPYGYYKYDPILLREARIKFLEKKLSPRSES